MRKSRNTQEFILDESARLTWKAFFVASQLLVEQIEHALSESGAGPLSQYDAVYTLSVSGEDGMTIRQLSASLALSHSGLSRMLDRLEAQGLVKRFPDPKDRRAVRLRLLPQGYEHLDRAWNVYAVVVREHFGAILEPDEMDVLKRICQKLASPLIEKRERTTRTPFVHDLQK